MFKALRIASSLCLAAACCWAQAQSPVAVYSFNNSFASSVAGAPALVPTDPLSQSGFVSDTVLGFAQTVWRFSGTANNAEQAGLTLNVSSLLAGRSDRYSIEIVFKFTERANNWRRIVDVNNRQSDNGFYVDPSNNLDIFPVAGGDAFTNDIYHDDFLVNNNGVATFYLDRGVATSATTHVMDIDSAGKIIFFLDNIVAGGQGEYSSGSVALIRIYDQALNAPPPAVPEPSTLALWLVGVAGVGAAVRRGRQTRTR